MFHIIFFNTRYSYLIIVVRNSVNNYIYLKEIKRYITLKKRQYCSAKLIWTFIKIQFEVREYAI